MKQFRDQHEGSDAQLSEMALNMKNNEQLMEQMKNHHQNELKKGEQVRKDLISQNSILHGQVEKVIFFSCDNVQISWITIYSILDSQLEKVIN